MHTARALKTTVEKPKQAPSPTVKSSSSLDENLEATLRQSFYMPEESGMLGLQQSHQIGLVIPISTSILLFK